jgi:hypothetical protein
VAVYHTTTVNCQFSTVHSILLRKTYPNLTKAIFSYNFEFTCYLALRFCSTVSIAQSRRKLAFYAFLREFEKAGGLGPIERQVRSAVFPRIWGVLGAIERRMGLQKVQFRCVAAYRFFSLPPPSLFLLLSPSFALPSSFFPLPSDKEGLPSIRYIRYKIRCRTFFLLPSKLAVKLCFHCFLNFLAICFTFKLLHSRPHYLTQIFRGSCAN